MNNDVLSKRLQITLDLFKILKAKLFSFMLYVSFKSRSYSFNIFEINGN